MFSQPASVITNPDLFHAIVRKIIRDIARGDGGDKQAVSNQTLATFALTCQKLHKFMQRRLDRRFYSGRPHHPLFEWWRVTAMKEYRISVINGMRQEMNGLAPDVNTLFGDLPKHGYGMESIVKTEDNYHGRVWVECLAPSLLNVRVFSVSGRRFVEQIQFLVYITYDTQGRYVVVDNIHGKRITKPDFHQLLRKRITDAFSRGDCPLA
jgi:hypothetical protein